MIYSVFLLEDDESIAELVSCALEAAEIDCACFSSCAEFKTALKSGYPHVALLDLMLPDGNGLDVLKELKTFSPQTICIILSALGKETDKVKGLNFGADDYISKPFGVLELTARVKAALRRVKSPSVLRIGKLVLNSDTRIVKLDGKTLNLKNKEFSLLKFFMENPNVALSRQTLLCNVWAYEGGETRTLDNYVAKLRKSGITNIVTVFGVGYKFIATE